MCRARGADIEAYHDPSDLVAFLTGAWQWLRVVENVVGEGECVTVELHPRELSAQSCTHLEHFFKTAT